MVRPNISNLRIKQSESLVYIIQSNLDILRIIANYQLPKKFFQTSVAAFEFSSLFQWQLLFFIFVFRHPLSHDVPVLH